VTDKDGELFEHNQFFASGEPWVQQNSNSERLPFLFTATELDQETDLYAFGARMYDPREQVWLSPDPGLPAFLAGQANTGPGVFVPRTLGLYGFAFNNPVSFRDSTGFDPEADDTTRAMRAPDVVYIGFTGANFPHEDDAGRELRRPGPLAAGQVGNSLRESAESAGLSVESHVYATDAGHSPEVVHDAAEQVLSSVSEAESSGASAPTIVIYGYSNGGGAALQLAAELERSGVDVDLLVTVDAAFGLWSDAWEVPGNVREAYNFYQTTSSVLGSRGYPLVSASPGRASSIHNTRVYGVRHASIDERTLRPVGRIINEFLQQAVPPAARAPEPPVTRQPSTIGRGSPPALVRESTLLEKRYESRRTQGTNT